MKNKVIRLLKITSISALIGIGVSYVLTSYVHSKMNEELPNFIRITDDIKVLNDVHSLCAGLLSVNPTTENVESCTQLYVNIDLKVKQIKEECPHISLYNKYIQKIEY